jgi:hypothetical protein
VVARHAQQAQQMQVQVQGMRLCPQQMLRLLLWRLPALQMLLLLLLLRRRRRRRRRKRWWRAAPTMCCWTMWVTATALQL